MDNASDLELLLRSHHPLLMAPVADEERFLDIVRSAARRAGCQVWLWSVTRGLQRDGMEPMYGTKPLAAALDFIAERADAAVYILADVHSELGSPPVVRRIKELAAGLPAGSTLILSGSAIATPPELEAVAHVWRLRPPDGAELRELVARTLRDLDARGFLVAIGPDRFDEVVASVSGLSTSQAERLIQRMALDDGTVDAADITSLGVARAEILSGDGILELVETRGDTLDDVGGLDGLKEWLAVRRRAMDEGGTGVDPVRGIMLTGVPGAGKSFVAKAIAASWKRPLLLLDPGRLYAKYLGESEDRLRRALDSADAMAPAVLWIDEIEKGFARHGDGDGGASARVLGTFLRWLQERTSDVFVVATANDVSALPPELARKGRFDEVFFVELPDPAARRAIFMVHLGRRDIDPTGVDLDALVASSQGYTGAEIEAAIVATRYRVVAGEPTPPGELIAAELAATVPLSRARAEDITRLREWARTRAVPAS
jgi:ATPase family associated with various cellular activities (AAA)